MGQVAGGVEVTSLLLNLSKRVALFTTILPEHSLAASSLTRVKVLGLKKCQPESRVQFSVFWRREIILLQKKRKEEGRKESKTSAQELHMLS